MVLKNLSQKYPAQDRADRVAQVVEWLPNNPGALSPNPSTAKKKKKKKVEVSYYLSFFFLAVLGLELRVHTLSHSTNPFLVMGSSEIGSLELFAQAGFELQSSRSLPPE
jgi:hypothetical protein